MVGEKGIPLKVNPYSAVPPVTVTPAGISHAREMVLSLPGIIGSGVTEAETHLKTDLPAEQSRTVFAALTKWVEAARAISFNILISRWT